VLDVGSGSGYVAAVLHQLVSEGDAQGKVVGIEHISELVAFSVENLRKDGLGPAMDAGQVRMVDGDGRKGTSPCSSLGALTMNVSPGFEEEGPYDAIHVGAAAPTLPQPLVDQLAKPGRMFIPVGTHSQSILQVDKDVDGSVTTKEVLDVMVRAIIVALRIA
jgi:protein-L-isoaspartate(D-aspartate) O-methyltransferase